MKNPIVSILNALPENGSKVIVSKDFCIQVLAWMRAADPKYNDLIHVDKLLWYLHEQGVVNLSYVEVDSNRINFIQRNLNGNETGKV